MASFSIKITKRAYMDMREVYSYIANVLKEPKTAINQIDRIDEGIRSLSEMPERIALVSDERLAAEGYRHLLIDNYYVFFIVNSGEKQVSVARILYARRDWQNII